MGFVRQLPDQLAVFKARATSTSAWIRKERATRKNGQLTDAVKMEWLRTESGLSNPWPVIPAAIRLWLQRQRELIEFRGIVPDGSG
jgi:hypothetical protein